MDNSSEADKVARTVMKNDPLIGTLVGVFGLSALVAVALCMLYVPNSRQLRSLQAQVSAINYRRAAVQSLANEAAAYSKQDPSINWVLESIKVKQQSNLTNP